MKLLLLSVLLIATTALSAQVKLTIVIDHLESSNGQIALQLNDVQENQVGAVQEDVKNKGCTIIFPHLEAGHYAFMYFHDANKNSKLDKNFLGIPKEGFGFSNNAKGSFGPPSHEKLIFTLSSDTTVHCAPLYF